MEKCGAGIRIKTFLHRLKRNATISAIQRLILVCYLSRGIFVDYEDNSAGEIYFLFWRFLCSDLTVCVTVNDSTVCAAHCSRSVQCPLDSLVICPSVWAQPGQGLTESQESQLTTALSSWRKMSTQCEVTCVVLWSTLKFNSYPQIPLCHIWLLWSLKMWHVLKIPCYVPHLVAQPSCSDQIVLRQATLIRNPGVSSDRFLLWKGNAKPTLFLGRNSRQDEEIVATDTKRLFFYFILLVKIL